ncbi:TPA: hypothetical protein QB638_002182 [Pasteurella multocida]|nr:hypothetical protein [Pasteurella multocida]
MSVSISGNFKVLGELAEQLNALGNKAVFVGVPENNNKTVEGDSSFNLASLAAVLEFGNEHIPERPFLRKTLIDNREKYMRMFAEGFRKGIPSEKIYSQIALIAQADVQENMIRGSWTPNNPKTIRRKRSSKPLIDTGRLRQSITGVVR